MSWHLVASPQLPYTLSPCQCPAAEQGISSGDAPGIPTPTNAEVWE